MYKETESDCSYIYKKNLTVIKTKNFNVLCFVCAKTASKAVLDMNSQVLEPVKVLSAGTRNQKT